MLQQTPEAFQRRLELVLRQALEDEEDGHGEIHFDVAGPSGGRYMRQWEAFFRAQGKAPNRKRP